MPTPLGVGNTSFREVARAGVVNRQGMDSMTVTLRGKSTSLSATFDTYSRGEVDATESSMYLDTKSYEERGPVSDIILNYVGFLESTTGEARYEIDDSITEQSVTLATDTGENVAFRYFAQSTTHRWIHRGSAKPTTPRYRGIVPSSLPTNQLFNPVPPNYTGSIAGRYEATGRLAQFQRTQVAPSVWTVVETWENIIEPI